MTKDSKPHSPRHSPIFTLVTLIASLGAVNSALIGFFDLDLVIYLCGGADDLAEAVYALIGFCGLCLFIFGVNLIIPRFDLKKRVPLNYRERFPK